MKKIIVATLAIAAMASCTKQESVEFDVSSDVVATFANAAIATRTSGNVWENTDEVGIFMYEADETDNTYPLAKENVLHTSDASGNFTVGTGLAPIYYPQTDVVDFYAYYPYSTLSGWLYTADITGQNLEDGSFDQGAIDFMTAALTDKSKSETALKFTFEHRLSMLTFVITPKASVPSLKGVEVSLNDINTQATFSVLTGALEDSKDVKGAIKFLTSETETDTDGNVIKLTATAIVLPEVMNSAAKIKFKFSETLSHSASFPTAPTLEAGKNHTYNISVGYAEASFAGGSTITGWGESDLPTDDIIDAEEDK